MNQLAKQKQRQLYLKEFVSFQWKESFICYINVHIVFLCGFNDKMIEWNCMMKLLV